MDVPSLVASVGTSFSVLKDMGTLLVQERDRDKLAAIKIEFSNKLIDAQAQLFQVLGTVSEQQRDIAVLEKRVRELEAEAAEKQRYQLAKLGSDREFFAYRLRPAAELHERVDEPMHFVCQPCFEAGKKHVLNNNGEGYTWCPVCERGAQVEPERSLGQPSGGERFGGFL